MIADQCRVTSIHLNGTIPDRTDQSACWRRILPMLPKLGYFGVIEQLVTNPKPSQGFLTLDEAGRRNETF